MKDTARRGQDPRIYQIATLSGFLIAGWLWLDFDLRLSVAAGALLCALTTQYILTQWKRLPYFEPKSALISGLSLCLLLRTDILLLGALAGVLAVASKFLIRWRGKHVFNPANFALVVTMLISEHAWVSPGQWGSLAFSALLIAGLGIIVINRAERSDVTFAFLGAYAAIVCARALYLGDPASIAFHQLQSGALLVFAFFMISDPKTTPDSRPGRVLYAALVAALAGFIQFGLYQPNGPIWALVLCAPLVPLIDRFSPAGRYHWSGLAFSSNFGTKHRRKIMKALSFVVSVIVGLMIAGSAQAFCGFYVARADTKLFNRASQVVLVRDDNKTVLTMANDFQGDVKDFAIVIPVPTFIERGQINVADKTLIDHLDAYSSPRLVEYFDEDPCRLMVEEDRAWYSGVLPSAAPARKSSGESAHGVTIEASYTVGEYDILILSAMESEGLITWLRENDYRIPDGAEDVVGSYLKQDMRFFVAKVNLEEQAKLGFTYLRPIQVAYESHKFMLPIRLGTVNANGTQELYIYALTKTGRVETTNYRTLKLPTGMELPGFIKHDFADFYRDMFTRQTEQERMRAVFLEYAWDMAWCDPCAADPLSAEELAKLGVFWLGERPANRGGAQNVFVTRLHLRYDGEHFPEDLAFQETGDRSNFQGRYVVRHPWKGNPQCRAAEQYFAQLPERQQREAVTLANLTGWSIQTIREKMGLDQRPDQTKWWQRLCKN